jgi:hypothetical protein
MGAESLDEIGPRRGAMDSGVVEDGGKEGEVESERGCFRHVQRVARQAMEVKKIHQLKGGEPKD